MGQGWSRFNFLHPLAACDNPARPDLAWAVISPSRTLARSQATTEASSSMPTFQVGLYNVSAADVELSGLQGRESEEEKAQAATEKEARCPTPSTSQLIYPLHAFLKVPEKAHPKKAAPAAGKPQPLKGVVLKPRACKQQPPRGSPSSMSIARLTPRPEPVWQTGAPRPPPMSLLSPPQAPEKAEKSCHEVAREEGGGIPSPELVPPAAAPAGAGVLFELDRKRKAPAGLPSLAVEYCVKLKVRTPLQRPSEGGSREAVLDLGTGDAMVGRFVKKAVGGTRGFLEGRVSFYNAALRSYQIKYDDGKEEAMEWLDLEPCLADQRNNRNGVWEEGKGEPTLRESLQNRPRFKKVDELVYTKRKSRGRQWKK